jgi:hypothetical protein
MQYIPLGLDPLRVKKIICRKKTTNCKGYRSARKTKKNKKIQALLLFFLSPPSPCQGGTPPLDPPNAVLEKHNRQYGRLTPANEIFLISCFAHAEAR